MLRARGFGALHAQTTSIYMRTAREFDAWFKTSKLPVQMIVNGICNGRILPRPSMPYHHVLTWSWITYINIISLPDILTLERRAVTLISFLTHYRIVEYNAIAPSLLSTPNCILVLWWEWTRLGLFPTFVHASIERVANIWSIYNLKHAAVLHTVCQHR